MNLLFIVAPSAQAVNVGDLVRGSRLVEFSFLVTTRVLPQAPGAQCSRAISWQLPQPSKHCSLFLTVIVLLLR